MAFRIHRQETPTEAVRRIATEQVDRSVARARKPGSDPGEAVHDVRKRCKKLRALLRLVRDSMGEEARTADARIRDAARRLSPVRDARAQLEAMRALRGLVYVPTGLVREIEARLADRAAGADARAEDLLKEFRADLKDFRPGIQGWTLADEDFRAVAGGMRRTYSRAQRAMSVAAERPTTDDFHEWRKRMKYHGHHLALLRDLWPDVLHPWRDQVDQLAEILGDEHDLAVLDRNLGTFTDPADAELLSGLILGRRATLRRQSFERGERLLAERPRALLARLDAYWRAWRSPTRNTPVVPVPEHVFERRKAG